MEDCYLTKKETSSITKRGATSLWRDVNAGTFPAPRQIGPRRVGWLKSEVMAWLESRPVAINKRMNEQVSHDA